MARATRSRAQGCDSNQPVSVFSVSARIDASISCGSWGTFASTSLEKSSGSRRSFQLAPRS